MNLQRKISSFFIILVASLVTAVLAIGLFSFRQYSITTAKEQIAASAEIVRVTLTEAMINGVIDKRESLLRRLMEVPGLRSVRVVRGPEVTRQFGQGLEREQAPDALEQRVLADGKPAFELLDDQMDTTFRGTIPYAATSRGSPNCMQCHTVAEGSVLGAVTITMSIENLRRNALLTLMMMVAAVGIFSLVTMLLMRRLTFPIVATARGVERAVHRAIEGDFDARIEVKTTDEIGMIAADMNRLLAFLDEGLNRIGSLVEQLTNRKRTNRGNLLNSTIQMVETLTKAAHFKQAIEEDESKTQIYARMSEAIDKTFGVRRFSIYEVLPARNQMVTMVVDGEPRAPCRWCDEQILTRSESCRARRTGHIVDGVNTPDICFAFKPPADDANRQSGEYRHICLPIIQSGAVGSVLQLVVPLADCAKASGAVPDLGIYLREAAPVLEARRLMETLRESTLRDPMTDLHNRRFLEESVDVLMAQAARRKSGMTVMMLDIDHFKLVNDTHGHDAGDAVLRALAEALSRSVRASDYVIRYGGEEFLVLLPDTAADTAIALAEKIRGFVAGLKITTAGGILQKTISIGLASYPEDSDSFWPLVKCADLALYHAKMTGRNKVVRFTAALSEKPDTR